MIAVAAIACVGCDLGVYGSRYSERLPELQARSAKAALVHAEAMPLESANGNSLQCQLRFPMLFDGESTRFTDADVAGFPSRAQPPSIPVPGLLFTFERYVQDPSGARLPIYAFVGGVPATQEAEAVEASILEAVSKVVPDNLTWEPVRLESLTGEVADWRMLRISAAQPFFVAQTGAESKSQSLEGQLYFFMRPVGDNYVILAWRFPSQLAEQINFPAAIEASVGTLK